MSYIRKDYDDIIALYTNIDNTLALELAKAITNEMKPEMLKDIGKERSEKLRECGFDSVMNLFESRPADISNAIQEPDSIAAKNIEYAKSKADKVTVAIDNEINRANVTGKKDLDKIDVKSLVTVTELSITKI